MKFLKLLKIIEKCAGGALIGACLCMATACEKQGKKAVDTETTQQSNEIDKMLDFWGQSIKEIQANTTLKVSKTTDNKIKLELVAIINEKKEITIEEIKAQLKWLGFKVID